MVAGGVDDLGVDVAASRRASSVSLRNKSARGAAHACSAGLQSARPQNPNVSRYQCGLTRVGCRVSRLILAHIEVAELLQGGLQTLQAIPCESDLAPRA